MDPQDLQQQQIDRLIREEIESVPHLEALLLAWNSRPGQWSLQQMAASLYISPHQTEPILQDLIRRGFLTLQGGVYVYNDSNPHDGLLAVLDETYRQQLVRVSTMIHSRPSSAVREFARAFKFKKD
jgi:hypothetical protein